tara:strand:- start:1564 stop:2202 length:639 start_codon:yes stop_codon:yes gene_type:complete
LKKYDEWASGDGCKIVDSIQKIPNTSPEKSVKETENEGELASKAFTLFKEGLNPLDVVIQLKKPPSIINQLYSEYKEIPPNTSNDEYPELINRLKKLEEKTSDIIGLISKQENAVSGSSKEDAFDVDALTDLLWQSNRVNKLVSSFSDIKSPGEQLKYTIEKIDKLTEKVEKIKKSLDSLSKECPKCGEQMNLVTKCKKCGKKFDLWQIDQE